MDLIMKQQGFIKYQYKYNMILIYQSTQEVSLKYEIIEL